MVAPTTAYKQGALTSGNSVVTGPGNVLVDGGAPPGPYVSLFKFGAKTNDAAPNFDNTSAFTSAIASGEPVLIPRGLFWVSGPVLFNSAIFMGGSGMANSIIKLLPGSNQNVFEGVDVNDLTLFDFCIDGNKSSQTPGQISRGLYLHATVDGTIQNMRLSRLRVNAALDHGLMFSAGGATYAVGKNSVVSQCWTTNCGSLAHQQAGGPGGTGNLAGGDPSCRITDCYSAGNFLNGFKNRIGKWIGSVADANGGGFETGFTTPGVTGGAVYLGCEARNSTSGTGFRHQGEELEITQIGCRSVGNYQSGITVINGIKRGVFVGNVLKNNGNGGTRTSTDGLDGITLLTTSGEFDNIALSGNHAFDDQGSPTQEYGIYATGSASNFSVDESNIIGTNKVAPVHYDFGVGIGANLHVAGAIGSSPNFANMTPVVVTGTTSPTDLMRHTVKAFERVPGATIRVIGTGSVSGTNGTKVIRLGVGGATNAIISEAMGDQNNWSAVAIIQLETPTSWRVQVEYFIDGGTSGIVSFTVSNSSSVDVDIFFGCTLGNALDSVTQASMKMRMS